MPIEVLRRLFGPALLPSILVILPMGAAFSNDLWEPNDSFEQAVEIFPPSIGGLPGRHLNAQLESLVAGDWYYRTGAGAIDMWVSAWIEDLPGGDGGSFFDTVLDLQRGDTGVTVASNDDIDETLPIRTSGLVGAPVPLGIAPVFSVRGFNGNVSGPYRLYTLVNLANSQDVIRDEVESEPNDSVNEAQLLGNGDNVRGTILSANEEDWYRVEMGTPDGWDLYVALKNFSEGAADFLLEVWEPPSPTPLNGRGLAGGNGKNDFLVIPFGEHSMGMKYFRVRSGGGTGNYRLFFGPGAPTPLDCSYPALPIPAGSISVITDTLSFNTPGIIGDLDVRVKIEHPNISDLIVVLRNVNTGIRVDLVHTSCPGMTDLDVIFDDEAPAPPAPCSFQSGDRVTPYLSLGTFDGIEAAGDWQLIIADIVPENGGTLISWCLELTEGTVAVPSPTPTVTPTFTLEPSATPTRTITPTLTCANSPDLDGNGEVDARDLIELLRQLTGSSTSPGHTDGDLDCNQVHNARDMIEFLKSWKTTTTP